MKGSTHKIFCDILESSFTSSLNCISRIQQQHHTRRYCTRIKHAYTVKCMLAAVASDDTYMSHELPLLRAPRVVTLHEPRERLELTRVIHV